MYCVYSLPVSCIERASKLGAPEGARSRHVLNQFVCAVANVLLYTSRLECMVERLLYNGEV